MKKLILILLIALFTLGCEAQPILTETTDVISQEESPQEQEVIEINVSDLELKEQLKEVAEKYNMNFFEHTTELVDNDRYIIVFESKYCEACRNYLPTLFEYINTESAEDLYLVDLEDTETHKLAEQLGITETPTTILIEKGVEVSRKVGTMTFESLVGFTE